MIISPLEQFTIIPLIVISNLSLFLIYILFILIIIFSYLNLNFILIKHFEWLYRLISNHHDHIFIFLSLFLLILISNLIGMIPFTFTITAQFIFVFSISITVFLSLNILGLSHHKFYFGYLFLPSGVPIFLIPLITSLELLLYFTRAISLALRLSANLLSGHILIKLLIYAFIQFPILSIFILPVFFLELLVAFLQAYIFIVLTLSYYQDISLPH